MSNKKLLFIDITEDDDDDTNNHIERNDRNINNDKNMINSSEKKQSTHPSDNRTLPIKIECDELRRLTKRLEMVDYFDMCVNCRGHLAYDDSDKPYTIPKCCGKPICYECSIKSISSEDYCDPCFWDSVFTMSPP